MRTTTDSNKNTAEDTSKGVKDNVPEGKMPGGKTSKGGSLEGKVIVQILPALNQGGVERGTIEVAEAIVKAGGEAVVISNGGRLERQLLRVGATHFCLPVHSKNPFWWWLIRYQVKRVLKRSGADLVHIRSRVPAWIVLPVAQILGLPVVSTIHGRVRPQNIFKTFYNNKITKSDHVIAISHHVFKTLTKRSPKLSKKMTVIHRGVDLSKFSPDKVASQRIVNLSKQLGIPDDKLIIMLPARPSPWKGALELLEAAALLNRDDFLIVLVGVSDGGLEFQEKIFRRIDKLGLGDKVQVCGHVDDMPAALMLADIVAMPSITPEPFGRVAIEASAMGVPVVAFSHGGVRETVIDEVTGWLARPVNVGSLAQCINKALALDKSQKLVLASRARKLIEKKFSSTKMCDDTIKVYLKMLEENET